MIQLGACDDKFTAADTAKLSATAYTGAATYAFIESIERWGVNQTYATLLQVTEAEDDTKPGTIGGSSSA